MVKDLFCLKYHLVIDHNPLIPQIKRGEWKTVSALNRKIPVGLKLSEGNYEQLKRVSQAEGKPMAEWCRDAVVERLNRQGVERLIQILLEEVVALRMIVVNLTSHALDGSGRVDVKRVLGEVEKAKLKKAEDVLNEAIKRCSAPG